MTNWVLELWKIKLQNLMDTYYLLTLIVKFVLFLNYVLKSAYIISK